MNNGDDSAYYLAKGCRVIGIDANPDLCRYCANRFRKEIDDGYMTVLNVGVGDREGEGVFSVNLAKHAISTFLPEQFEQEEWAPKEWRKVKVSVVRLSRVIDRFGEPHFVKIDVEHYDRKVLLDLLRSGKRPPFISTEAHHLDAYRLLVQMGYRRFRLVEGAKVSALYGATRICRFDGSSIHYSFPHDSSGPFAEDLPGEWLDPDTALSHLLAHGLGWIDIHATL